MSENAIHPAKGPQSGHKDRREHMDNRISFKGKMMIHQCTSGTGYHIFRQTKCRFKQQLWRSFSSLVTDEGCLQEIEGRHSAAGGLSLEVSHCHGWTIYNDVGKTMSYTTQNCEWFIPPIYVDDWGMVYYCFTHSTHVCKLLEQSISFGRCELVWSATR